MWCWFIWHNWFFVPIGSVLCNGFRTPTWCTWIKLFETIVLVLCNFYHKCFGLIVPTRTWLLCLLRGVLPPLAWLSYLSWLVLHLRSNCPTKRDWGFLRFKWFRLAHLPSSEAGRLEIRCFRLEPNNLLDFVSYHYARRSRPNFNFNLSARPSNN